jgi:16S rRNA (adenine1518-N6/adenine1519-N6)-dimethyltransferase
VDRAALGAILSAAEIGDDDEVLEVGPGPGVLSLELAQRAKRLRTISRPIRTRS